MCTVVVGPVAQRGAPVGDKARPLRGWGAGQLLDHRTCGQSRGTLCPACPPPWNHTPQASPAHTRGTPAHPASMAPPPPQPGAHTTDVVAVVTGPQRCRLESGHPVLCGCSSRWGWGTGSPANRSMQRPRLLAFLYTHTHTHMCTRTCAHRHVESQVAPAG